MHNLSIELSKENWKLIIESLNTDKSKTVLTNAYNEALRQSTEILNYKGEKLETPAAKKYKESCEKYQKQKEEIAKKYREELIRDQTQAEIRMKEHLNKLGIKYEFQKIYYTPTTFYIADFYLPDYNIIVEVDGKYHNTEEQKEKDSERSRQLIFLGVKRIKRLSNKQVMAIPTKIITKVLQIKTVKKLTNFN